MNIIKTKTIPTIILSLLLGLAGESSVNGFKIDFLTTFVPFDNITHIGQPVHEEITRDAITNVTPAASSALIANLQSGVQNADIIHQFDSESHFDNCSVALNVGFSNGFSTMHRRFAAARPNALNNPEFLAPHYTSFLEISANVVAALAALATDPECLLQPACPTSRAAADAAIISGLLPGLVINPNPDTHRASNPRSLFHYPPDTQGGLSGYLGPVQEAYLEVIGIVEDAVARALGDHFDPACFCDRNLAQVLGSSNSHVVRLQRLRNALRAYHAHQDLGHAMHAAQDFFAHSDYVELMAGVGVGQMIPPGAVVLLPTSFSQFNLAGLQTLMGSARFNQLESGEVLTIWLGEGDFSLGDAGIQNFFNPDSGIEIGGIDVFGINLPPVAISSVGQNPNPFPGFNHGHYLSSTALGLNKDCAFDPAAPGTSEPAHRNHLPARQAAVQMSALMWRAFLQSIGEMAAPVLLTCPTNRVVAADPGQCYATGVDLGAPSVSGGCETAGVTNDAPVQFTKGTNLVRWIAVDSCGNSATCIQTIRVVDREPPRLVCATNRVVNATSSNGATVVFTAMAAGDNCPGVRVVCLPPSGATFPVATNTVRCTATDTSGNIARCNFTVVVLRARGVKQDVLNELIVLRAKVTDKMDGKKLDEAIKSLGDALAAALWMDETHLDRQRGEMVFQKDKETVQKLAEVIADKKSKVSKASLQGFIDRIVRADRLLALVALNEGVAAAISPMKIAEARKELARGDQAAASGQADEAIEHYRDAWKQVLPVKLMMKADTQSGSRRLALIGLQGETCVRQASGHLKDWIRPGTAIRVGREWSSLRMRATGSLRTATIG